MVKRPNCILLICLVLGWVGSILLNLMKSFFVAAGNHCGGEHPRHYGCAVQALWRWQWDLSGLVGFSTSVVICLAIMSSALNSLRGDEASNKSLQAWKLLASFFSFCHKISKFCISDWKHFVKKKINKANCEGPMKNLLELKVAASRIKEQHIKLLPYFFSLALFFPPVWDSRLS